jgi:hypothetical protein
MISSLPHQIWTKPHSKPKQYLGYHRRYSMSMELQGGTFRIWSMSSSLIYVLKVIM